MRFLLSPYGRKEETEVRFARTVKFSSHYWDGEGLFVRRPLMFKYKGLMQYTDVHIVGAPALRVVRFSVQRLFLNDRCNFVLVRIW